MRGTFGLREILADRYSNLLYELRREKRYWRIGTLNFSMSHVDCRHCIRKIVLLEDLQTLRTIDGDRPFFWPLDIKIWPYVYIVHSVRVGLFFVYISLNFITDSTALPQHLWKKIEIHNFGLFTLKDNISKYFNSKKKY